MNGARPYLKPYHVVKCGNGRAYGTEEEALAAVREERGLNICRKRGGVTTTRIVRFARWDGGWCVELEGFYWCAAYSPRFWRCRRWPASSTG